MLASSDTRTCPQCGKEFKLSVIPEGGMFGLAIKAAFPDGIVCDECAESNRLKVVKEERDKFEEELPELYSLAGIPRAFVAMPSAPRQDVCKWLWERRERNVLLYGDTGVGKTTAAARVLMRFVQMGERVKFMSFSRFIDLSRATRMRRPDSMCLNPVEDMFRTLNENKIVCIDEIAGKTRNSDSAFGELFDLIDMAYNGTLSPLWLIGNVREKSLDMLFGEEVYAVKRRLSDGFVCGYVTADGVIEVKL